jgi:serine/threonine-protein kinase
MNESNSREGTQFGPYRLLRLIGKGGMGEVYEAEDTVKDRVVALKLLPESVSQDPVFRTRLQREAHSAGRLHEPHVVPIHDYGEVDGTLFVDMRMINGSDLRKLLKNFGPMAPARAVAIVRQIASALDAAHEAGIMHRDVKPENVLVTGDDFVYLVDFGIANAATDEKLTEFGTAVGTYAYMAPERFTSDEVTYRADIYALACVLYECLAGSQPYTGDSVSVLITAHLMQPIPRPSVERPGIPAALDHVIARGMAKRADERFASAGDLAMAATAALTSPDQDQAAAILQRGQAAPAPGLPFDPNATMAAPGRLMSPPPPPPPSWTPPPGSAPPGAAPPGAGPPRGNKVPWIPLAAIGGVVVVLIAALGIFLVMPDDKASGPTTPMTSTKMSTSERASAPRTRTTTDASGASLLALIPPGYPTSACEVASPTVTGALATVDCGPSTQPGGPQAARYSLFDDVDQLAQGFADSIAENDEIFRCPGSDVDSPTDWHYKRSPDVVAGQVACGTYQGNADVIWTQNDDLILADVQSSDIDELHIWWLNYS